MTDRRTFLRYLARGILAGGAGSLAPGVAGADPRLATRGLPAGANDAAILDALPGKRPLIKRTWRPPNYETPLELLGQPFTPNDAFFVRYHLTRIPEVSRADWKLEIGGDAAERPLTLRFGELTKDYEQVELAALCLCSGNRRGLSDPHVPGVEWGYGAMGNARWKGVRLRDVLARAGVKREAVEVTLQGTDAPVLATTPEFVKSLPIWKALDENTLLAWDMNGEPLPHWNGHPVRLVVPGWTATYWVKQIATIRLVSQPFQGFWVKSAYRIPKGKFALVDRFVTQESDASTPITEILVASLVTNLRGGERFEVGQRVEVKGIAWDGGHGMQGVEVSTDGGRSWRAAQLGKDLGRFSWRPWEYAFRPGRRGVHTVMARATDRIGGSQTFELNFNPAGYHNNVVQRLDLQVG